MNGSFSTYSKYRVALLEWYQEEVGHVRTIYIGKDPLTLFDEVCRAIVSYTDVLWSAYSEYINLSDLELVHEQFGKGNYPGNGWSWIEVQNLLRALLQEHREEMKHHPQQRSILGEWYQLVEWINDSCLPHDVNDRVSLPIEDDLPAFVQRLLKHETRRYRPNDTTPISDSDFLLLGRLAALASCEEREWNSKETFKLFSDFIDGFNERFGNV